MSQRSAYEGIEEGAKNKNLAEEYEKFEVPKQIALKVCDSCARRKVWKSKEKFQPNLKKGLRRQQNVMTTLRKASKSLYI